MRTRLNFAESKYGQTAAYIAAAQGNGKCLLLLAQHSADLSKRDKDVWAPIHAACQIGRYFCVEVLLDNRVDANLAMADEYGETPGIISCKKGHVKILALLLDRGKARQGKALYLDIKITALEH